MRICAIFLFIGMFFVIQGQIAFGDIGDMYIGGIKAKSLDEIKLVSESKYGACSLLHKKNVFSDESAWYFRCLTGTIVKRSAYYSYPVEIQIQCAKNFRNVYNVYIGGLEKADWGAETVDARFTIGTTKTVELSSDEWARGWANFSGEQIAKLIDIIEKSKRGDSFIFQIAKDDVHSIEFTGKEREGIGLFLSKCSSF